MKALFLLGLLSSAGAIASTPAFLLGADYSELASFYGSIATDSSGALYGFTSCQVSGSTSYSCVAKLSADGQTILWQNYLNFQFNSNIAVDPSGGVYVAPLDSNASSYLAKLNASGLAWMTPITPAGIQMIYRSVAADSQGRAYVTGRIGPTYNNSAVARLNAAGSAIDYTAQIPGFANGIAVDSSGAAYVVGNATAPYLARVAPDGSAGFNTSLPQLTSAYGVAVNANGSGVVVGTAADGSGLLLGFDSTGAITFSSPVASRTAAAGGFYLALDAAGNAYVTGSTVISDVATPLLPVKNSLSTCGTEWLSVFAPDGALLQTTYAPPGEPYAPTIAVGPGPTVFLVHSAGSTFGATQGTPFQLLVPLHYLWRLSPHPDAQTFPLGCLGSSVNYLTGPISPGDLVTLFGNGLGPQQGVQPQASLETPFPTQAAGVQVTFDGRPAPLLWVQDTQINVVAPWELTPGQTTQVCVTYNAVKTNCLSWPVVQETPAVFTSDGVHALALNQDGTVNSAMNPASFGQIVTVFAAGLGPISPQPADGSLIGMPLPSNVLPVQVGTVTGGVPFGIPIFTPFNVTYAGPAPGLVAGVSQINFQLASHSGEITMDGQSFQIYVSQ